VIVPFLYIRNQTAVPVTVTAYRNPEDRNQILVLLTSGPVTLSRKNKVVLKSTISRLTHRATMLPVPLRSNIEVTTENQIMAAYTIEKDDDDDTVLTIQRFYS
jgi:hypothetical protein